MTERGFMDVMKDVLAEIAPGLKDFVPEIKAELSRLTTQGAAELAAAIFGNGAYVQYGAGQHRPSPEVVKENPEQEVQKPEPVQEKQQEQARGGRER